MTDRPAPPAAASRRRRPKGDGGTYYDRTRSRWVGERVIGGQRRRVVGKSRAEVANRLRDLAAQDAAGGIADPHATVADVLVDWRTYAAPNRTSQPATLDAYDWAINRLTEVLGRRKVAELRAAHIEAAMRRLADRGLSRSSLVKVRSVLNMALKRATAHRVIAHNPVVGVEIPHDARPPAPPEQVLTPHEAEVLQEALEGHEWEAMYLLMLTGGLRPGEAAAVCADVIDLGPPATVEVRRSRKLAKGKGGIGDTLKTDKSHRRVDLPQWTADALAHRIKAEGLSGGELLFPDERGGVLTPGVVNDRLAEVLTGAGLPVVTANILRHTHATILVDAGVPLHLVSERLGHADLRMLLRTYRHRPDVATGASAMPTPTRRRGHLRAVG